MVQNERANAGLVKQIWKHIREQTEATSQEDHVKEKSTRWGGRLWKVPTEQMGGLIRRSKGPKLGCTEENTVARKWTCQTGGRQEKARRVLLPAALSLFPAYPPCCPEEFSTIHILTSHSPSGNLSAFHSKSRCHSTLSKDLSTLNTLSTPLPPTNILTHSTPPTCPSTFTHPVPSIGNAIPHLPPAQPYLQSQFFEKHLGTQVRLESNFDPGNLTSMGSNSDSASRRHLDLRQVADWTPNLSILSCKMGIGMVSIPQGGCD